MPAADLVIAGGTVVSPSGRRRLNVAVTDGVVTYVGTDRPSARETVDAGGLLVMPGGVDTHVHLMDPETLRAKTSDGYRCRSCLRVTTIIEHSHGRPVRSVADLTDKAHYLRRPLERRLRSGRPCVAGTGSAVADLWAAGAAFFKVFTCTTHGVPGHDAAALKAHLQASALCGR